MTDNSEAVFCFKRMNRIKILITGAKGQLGLELNELSKGVIDYSFDFADSKALDISSEVEIKAYFKNSSYDYCINCAAYTAVDKCEDEKENSEQVNHQGVAVLADACKEFDVVLIHISTDFVFDGKNNRAYIETDKTNPINYYGKSKLLGEEAIQNRLDKYYILRTSWLYSSFKSNFVKTMLKLSESRDVLNIIDDQIGTPTYARDLAKVILRIIEERKLEYGIYHYSNEGVASWYDFAKMIFEYSNKRISILPIATEQYPLPAERPIFSVLNKNKIKKGLNITIPHWTESLKDCIKKINN